jgi:hypothetical protein
MPTVQLTFSGNGILAGVFFTAKLSSATVVAAVVVVEAPGVEDPADASVLTLSLLSSSLSSLSAVLRALFRSGSDTLSSSVALRLVSVAISIISVSQTRLCLKGGGNSG